MLNIKLFEKEKINIGIYLIKEFRVLGRACFRIVGNLQDGTADFYVCHTRIFRISHITREAPKRRLKKYNPENSKIAKVSIIIDLVGANEILPETLNSVLHQSFHDFEIIIVGELEKEKIDELVRKNPILCVEKDIWTSIKRAGGEYIAFCQNGDIWATSYLEKKTGLAELYGKPVAITNDIKFAGNERYCGYLKTIVEDRKIFLNEKVCRIPDNIWRNHDIVISPSCWMIKKSGFESCKFGDVCHPFLLYAWLLRQICPENEIVYVSEKLVKVTLDESGINRFSINPLYVECQLIKGDQLLGYKNRILPVFPDGSRQIIKSFRKNGSKKRRLAIFASYSQSAVIEDYVVHYLKALSEVVDGIVFIMDNPVMSGEIDKIGDYIIYAECKRHNEYDFGSYKRGFEYLSRNDLLKEVDELIVCNDSCYGSLFPFNDIFHLMNNRGREIDFWGISGNNTIKFHIQSFFYVFKKEVFNSRRFSEFLLSVKEECDVKGVILYYEIEFTEILRKEGFLCDTLLDYPITSTRIEKLVRDKCPLIKVKMVKDLIRKQGRSYRKFRLVMRDVNTALLEIIEKDLVSRDRNVEIIE